jgi:7-dehydrocholesterol reductase
MISFFYVCNFFGYALTFFAYFKANYFSSHPQDNKYSGSFLYDLIMGVEFNPRIGNVDFKLFFNGRPGIVLWNILNLCYAYKQFETFGTLSNTMIALNVLQFAYILDFFWYEAWYLKTIDIAHDHFGFYLAWGDLV